MTCNRTMRVDSVCLQLAKFAIVEFDANGNSVGLILPCFILDGKLAGDVT